MIFLLFDFSSRQTVLAILYTFETLPSADNLSFESLGTHGSPFLVPQSYPRLNNVAFKIFMHFNIKWFKSFTKIRSFIFRSSLACEEKQAR